MNEIHLCDYGCGKEASYYFKSVNKWCCESSTNKCPEIRRKNSDSNSGKKRPRSKEHQKKISLANTGKKRSNEVCKKISIVLIGHITTEETKSKISKGNKEYLKNHPCSMTGRHHTEESKKKISIKNTGQKTSNELREIRRKNATGRKHTQKFIEDLRQRCLNGHSLKMIKAIKKISNEEIKLRNMVKELYQNCEFQYPVFNYSLDVALLEYKIAIEFDGYFHFNCQENIDYYKNRQKRIENEGWKFYRVAMFDKFPTLDEVKEKIEILIKEVYETTN